MNKLDWVLMFILPGMRTAAQLLANKDANSTGADDEAAAAILYAIERLEKFQVSK